MRSGATKKTLAKRVFCAECGAIRIRQGRSRYAVCPNGHGKLVPGFTPAERRQAIIAMLPKARRAGRHAFQIDGHDGVFDYRAGNGRRRVGPDAQVQADELVACYLAAKRAYVRVFARKRRRQRGHCAETRPEMTDMPARKP